MDVAPTQKDRVIEALKTVLDPELFIDVWTLGLIYDLRIEERKLFVTMTFTSMACPAGPQLVSEIKEKMIGLDDFDSCDVEVVFKPPWQPSEELKAMLGI